MGLEQITKGESLFYLNLHLFLQLTKSDLIVYIVCCMCVCVFSEPQEPMQRELIELDQELEKQTVQLREWQMQELLKLRQSLHLLEREKQQAHLQEVTSHTHLCMNSVRALLQSLHIQGEALSVPPMNS